MDIPNPEFLTRRDTGERMHGNRFRLFVECPALVPVHRALGCLRGLGPAVWAGSLLCGVPSFAPALQLDWHLRLAQAPVAADAPPPRSGAPAWVRWLDAVIDNPALAEAEAQADAAEARHRRGAREATWPRLDAQASGQRGRQVGDGRAVDAPATSHSLTLSMPLWRPAEQREVQGLQATGQATRLQALATRSELALGVSQAYLAGLHAQARASIRARQIAELEALEQVQARLLTAGLLTLVDVQATRSLALQVQDQWLQDQGDAAQQLLTLRRLVGPTASLPRGLHTPAPGPFPPRWHDREGGDVAVLVRAHPLAEAAQAQIRAAQARVEARQAARWLPTVEASASRGYRQTTPRSDGVADRQSLRNDSIGVSAQWTLFGADTLGDGERIAAAELVQALARHDVVVAELARDLRAAIETHRLEEQHLGARTAWLRHAEAALDAVHRAWLAGLRPTSDRLRAQQAVLDAALAVADSQVARMTSGTRILALLGKLDAAHIAPWLAEIDHPTSDLATP